jgi:hypothetical protein
MGANSCCPRISSAEGGEITIRNLDDDPQYANRADQPRFVGSREAAASFLALLAGVTSIDMTDVNISWAVVDQDVRGATGCKVTGGLIQPPDATLEFSVRDIAQIRKAVNTFGDTQLIETATDGVTVTLAPEAYAFDYRQGVPVPLQVSPSSKP